MHAVFRGIEGGGGGERAITCSPGDNESNNGQWMEREKNLSDIYYLCANSTSVPFPPPILFQIPPSHLDLTEAKGPCWQRSLLGRAISDTGSRSRSGATLARSSSLTSSSATLTTLPVRSVSTALKERRFGLLLAEKEEEEREAMHDKVHTSEEGEGDGAHHLPLLFRTRRQTEPRKKDPRQRRNEKKDTWEGGGRTLGGGKRKGGEGRPRRNGRRMGRGCLSLPPLLRQAGCKGGFPKHTGEENPGKKKLGKAKIGEGESPSSDPPHVLSFFPPLFLKRGYAGGEVRRACQEDIRCNMLSRLRRPFPTCFGEEGGVRAQHKTGQVMTTTQPDPSQSPHYPVPRTISRLERWGKKYIRVPQNRSNGCFTWGKWNPLNARLQASYADYNVQYSKGTHKWTAGKS